jgi:hypothetical protein
VADVQGNLLLATNAYTELGTGMHYWDGQWREADETITQYPNGFAALKCQHKLLLTKDINTAAAIDVLMPDGTTRLQATPLGLAYLDRSTGKSVLLAELTNSVGELVAPNQVLYRDCFTDIAASVRVTMRLGSFEQDIILHESPPDPSQYGFNPQTTLLEVWTELNSTPGPQKVTRVWPNGEYCRPGNCWEQRSMLMTS